MMAGRHYLDHNATTPISPGARAAMADAFDVVGNPSSVHGEGRAARALVDQARRLLADRFGAPVEAVTFSSGATEANNLVVGHALRRGWPVFASATEHLSVLDAGDDIAAIPVAADGVIDLAALDDSFSALDGNASGPFLACVMLANNETGVVQPLRDVAALVRARGGHLLVDAVQAVGKLDFDLPGIGADYLTVSAHKFGGPKGVGALIRASDAVPTPDAAIRGGGQERNLRAGTENVVGIAGLAGAIADLDARLAKIDEIRRLRDWFEATIGAISPAASFFGATADRLANTSCFAVGGIGAETAVIRFDLAGVAVGSGSACSSGKVAPSHVLRAMGATGEECRGAIRVSLGPDTAMADVEAAASVWRTIADPEQSNNAAAA